MSELLARHDRKLLLSIYRTGLVAVHIQRYEATVADLERQLKEARALLERRRAKLDWWEQLWEMARNADPGLHETLRDRFEAEEG